MPYAMFYDRFPDIAEKETRILIVFNDPDLPPDTYALTALVGFLIIGWLLGIVNYLIVSNIQLS